MSTLKEVCEELNREHSEKYVGLNNDLKYFESTWNIVSMVQKGINYNGEFIPSWNTVEPIIKDFYLDQILVDGSKEKRVESSMKMHDILIEYLAKKTNKENPGNLPEYIKNKLY